MSAVAKSTKQSPDRRSYVLRVLRDADTPMSIAAIAEILDVHPNTVRFHLETLVGAGRVEQVESDRTGPGRPALMFRATRRMDPAGPRHYQLLAEMLALELAHDQEAPARALAAGRDGGTQLKLPPPTTAGAPDADESIEHLVDVLDQLGFAPEHRGDDRLGLRNCVFLELAETQRAVICPIHLGLMQGALETWDAPVTADRLEPFVEPDLCLVHLTRQITTT
ncbi:helix-turn-helix transcriptional regulator [Mycobacterium sp.]|uniref:helix-turn-helix transcriptional regulator n=1 Tax=Mycobacterium sp. TaxID=1785 RepID=UPI003C71323A